MPQPFTVYDQDVPGRSLGSWDENGNISIPGNLNIGGNITALGRITDPIPDFWVNVQKQPGIVYNGSTDDSHAYQAFLQTIPAAAGNEVGGIGIFHPHGVMLLNTAASNALALIDSKPNVTIMGTGFGSRIRTTTANVTDFYNVRGGTNLSVQNILFQVLGTANVVNGFNMDCPINTSMHNIRTFNVGITCSGGYRSAWDFATVASSTTVYSSMAAFSAADNGGVLTLVPLARLPLFTTIVSTATLSGILAADMNTSTTTLTLNVALPGAPASGFTINVGGTERMLVTAGGNTTTLTVTRGRGVAGAGVAHTAGETVVTYSAVLADAPTWTTSNGTVGGRIQSAGTAIMQYGLAMATGNPGSSTLDFAGSSHFGLTVSRAAVAGVHIGNGTPANILDNSAYELTVSESGCAVLADGGSLSIYGCDFDNNITDYKKQATVTEGLIIQGGRSESATCFYDCGGSSTSGPPVTISTIDIASWNGEHGIPMQHLNAGPLLLQNMTITADSVHTPTILIVAAGPSSTNPCPMTAINIGAAAGNGDIFSSSVSTTCVKTVIGSYRLAANGTTILNTVLGFETVQRMMLRGGFGRARTAVADAAYTILTTDMTIAYTSLTAARVVNLPAQGSTLLAGQEFLIKDESGNCSLVNTLTITPPAGTIDGAATLVLNSAYAKANVYTNGTNWFTR